MELRCRFLDRFGDLNKLPLLHFLYLDTDKEAGEIAGLEVLRVTSVESMPGQIRGRLYS